METKGESCSFSKHFFHSTRMLRPPYPRRRASQARPNKMSYANCGGTFAPPFRSPKVPQEGHVGSCDWIAGRLSRDSHPVIGLGHFQSPDHGTGGRGRGRDRDNRLEFLDSVLGRLEARARTAVPIDSNRGQSPFREKTKRADKWQFCLKYIYYGKTLGNYVD